MGIPPWKWRYGRPLSPLALSDQMGISLPGISLLTRSGPSLSGVRPPPGFTGTPMGSGGFSGLGQTPAIRQALPLHFGGTRPLPNRTTATITSLTAPAVTMVSYGGVSTSTSLERPIPSLGIAYNTQVSAPLGQNQPQWSGAIPQGVQLPYTQGTSDIPLDQALNGVFPGGIPAAMEQYLAPTMEPDFSSFRRQSGRSPHITATAAVGCDGPLSGLSSRLSLRRKTTCPCLPL